MQDCRLIDCPPQCTLAALGVTGPFCLSALQPLFFLLLLLILPPRPPLLVVVLVALEVLLLLLLVPLAAASPAFSCFMVAWLRRAAAMVAATAFRKPVLLMKAFRLKSC